MNFYCESEHAARPQLAGAKPLRFWYDLSTAVPTGAPVIADAEAGMYRVGVGCPVRNLDDLAAVAERVDGIYPAAPSMGGMLNRDRWETWNLWCRLIRDKVTVRFAVTDAYIYLPELATVETIRPLIGFNVQTAREIYPASEVLVCIDPYMDFDKKGPLVSENVWRSMIDTIYGMGASPVLWLGGWGKRAFGEDPAYPGERLPDSYFKAMA